MTPEDLATATAHVQISVLWSLLVAAIFVVLLLAALIVKSQERNRALRSREADFQGDARIRSTEIAALREKMLDIEARLQAALRESRRAAAIRLKTERRLVEQNTEIDALRRDRDWLKRIVDHVET